MRADRGEGVGEKNPEYAVVTDMFRRLKTLDAGSDSFGRQRAEIIDRCLPLADHIAWRFRNRGQPLDDLIQTARVGLVGAVNRYDVDHPAIDRELVVEATIAASNCSTLSTDAQGAQEGENRPIGDNLGDIDPSLDRVLNVETVRPLIAALPERQRTALMLRFFENMTQTDIAEQLGCSQMHVSRLLACALETLRGQVRAADLAAAG
jgi:RNA polymerase sigma factor (sigma-70 family)